MKTFKRVVDIITSVALTLAIVFAFLLVGVRIFGLKPYTVLSGSMEPEYHVGSIIYVRKTGVSDLAIDDPVTYTIGETVVTHRIVEIIVDEDNPTNVKYRVKGDANDEADGDPVPFSNVIGKPVFTIPLLGYVAYYVRTPLGIALIVSTIILLICLAFIPDIINKIVSEGESSAELERLKAEREEAERLLRELKDKREE